MIGLTFLAHLDLFRWSSLRQSLPARDTDVVLSDQILSASQSDENVVLGLLHTSPEGLDTAEADLRRASAGPNLIVQEGGQGAPQELWGRAKNPLNALLLCLAAASYSLGDIKATVIITVIVTLAITMAFVQEHRSNQAAAKLRAMVKATVRVKRQGAGSAGMESQSNGFCELPIEELVPGDIVRLSAGDMIPADLRLLSAKDLFIDQSALTGEAMPVEKAAQPYEGPVTIPFDVPNLCLMGSSVIRGFATGVIVHTGAKTYFGQLASQIAGRRELTSFDKGVNRFIWLMIRFMLVLAPSVFLINGVTKGDWWHALLFALAVAVGLTPEMLPMIVTVNLAKGAIAMSRKRVIVKRLNAIQNFGAMNVLCTDKTGTLTQNKIVLSLHLDVRGDDNERVLEYAYLNSLFQSGLKSLLDGAVLDYVEPGKNIHLRQQYNCIDEIPFDFGRRRLSVVLSRDNHDKAPESGKVGRFFARLSGVRSQESGAHILICKGAFEEVLSACKNFELGDKFRPLSPRRRAEFLQKARNLNADGLRVLAVAFKEFYYPKKSYAVADESDLTLLGFIAFLDPPKDSAGAAIAALNRSGVAVKVLTGDNEIVTRKICREVGLEIDRIALGPEIEKTTVDELADLAERVTVFAKVSPEQKARIVSALHSRAMSSGSSATASTTPRTQGRGRRRVRRYGRRHRQGIGGHHPARKKPAGAPARIIEGRKVFGNIVKYIKMGASSNFGSMFSVLGASLFLPFLPMLPIQVLTNNLLYDFSQTAIPTDNVDEDYLVAPRKWDIDNIFKFMVFIGPISSIFDYATFLVMLYIFDGWNNATCSRRGGLLSFC